MTIWEWADHHWLVAPLLAISALLLADSAIVNVCNTVGQIVGHKK